MVFASVSTQLIDCEKTVQLLDWEVPLPKDILSYNMPTILSSIKGNFFKGQDFVHPLLQNGPCKDDSVYSQNYFTYYSSCSSYMGCSSYICRKTRSFL